MAERFSYEGGAATIIATEKTNFLELGRSSAQPCSARLFTERENQRENQVRPFLGVGKDVVGVKSLRVLFFRILYEKYFLGKA